MTDYANAADKPPDLPPTDDVPPSPEPTPEDKPGKRSAAAQLVDLAMADYTLGMSDTDEPYAVARSRPHLAMPLRGGKTGFRAELARRYYEDHNLVPAAQALTDATAVLEGKAAQCDPTPLYLRVAARDGATYVDLGDTTLRAVRILGGDWEVIDHAPVLFRRTKLTGVMADPQRGGDLAALWEFVPVAESDRPVLLAVLVHALIDPDTPHTVLSLTGEQGTSKSSSTRALVDLIDPSPVPLRQSPRDPESWVTAAAASWVVALDNLSAIPTWLSESLCRAATGDGNVKRALYTDSDVSVTQFRRCVLLNGIDLGALRPDLAERMVTAELTPIRKRRTESDIADDWAQARPAIFGALLDLAAAVHRRLPATMLTNPPRMADFARIATAVDAELGTNGYDRYADQSKRMAADSLAGDEFAARMAATRFECENKTASDILAALTPTEKEWRKPKDWPNGARQVTTLLRRNAPTFRKLGWSVSDDGGRTKDGITRWTIHPPSDQGGNSRPADPPYPHPQVNDPFHGGLDGGSDEATTPPGGSGGSMAGQPKTSNPPKTGHLTCEDRPAGQAGQKYASAPHMPCPVCDLPTSPGMDIDGMHPDCHWDNSSQQTQTGLFRKDVLA